MDKKYKMTFEGFCYKWLPANQHSGDFSILMEFNVAYPFEYGCYESWGLALKVKILVKDLSTYTEIAKNIETPVDVLVGWEGNWCHSIEELDRELEKRFEQLYGRKYEIGDTCTLEMRRVVKFPDAPK